MRLYFRIAQRLGLALMRQRVPALAALVLATGGGTYLLWQTATLPVVTAEGDLPIEVTVQPLQTQGSNVTLTLKEKNGNRRVAMNIGDTEARVIAREKGQRVAGDQPQAYDLLRDAIQEMGGKVQRILVNDANRSQYYAQIVVTTSVDTKVLRARPADAVALALKSGAPIFVEDRVLDEFGVKDKS